MAYVFTNIETDFSSLQEDQLVDSQDTFSKVPLKKNQADEAELFVTHRSPERIVEQRDRLRNAIDSCRKSFSYDNPPTMDFQQRSEAPFADITQANSNRSSHSHYRIIRSTMTYEEPSRSYDTMSTADVMVTSKRKQSKRSPGRSMTVETNTDYNDYSEKPGWSYPSMVALAMFHSERGCLTVSEVYSFIEEHFPYFRTAPACWKNSVRHNLSLNRCFEKCEENSNGRGLLWRIVEDKKDKLQNDILKWRERHSERTNLGSATQKDLCKILRKENNSCSTDDSVSEQWVESEDPLSATSSESMCDSLEQTYFEEEDISPPKVEASRTNMQPATAQLHTPVKESEAPPLLSPGNVQSPTTNRYHQCGGVYDSVCHALDENSLMFDAFQ